MPPPLHPELVALAPLVGEWEGGGLGEYPTIEPFAYREAVTFGHNGKPFLAYSQRTTAADDGRPLHAETGYWRSPQPGRIELVLAHPTGVGEVASGTIEVVGGRTVIDVHSTVVALTPTAKEVRAVARTFTIEGDVLRYSLRMAAVGHPLTHHLTAELHRLAR